MGKKIDLDEISTRAPKGFDKDETKEKLAELVEELNELQNVLFANENQSLLIVLQGLDASGKDGTVKSVFSAVNPQGVHVKSFKGPTEIERAHDFLWRIHSEVPAKGLINVFNRSHYEDVLVTRVLNIIDDETAKERFKQINMFEKLLASNNTHVLKFYLHISEEEQEKRFQERLDDPRKNWKFNPNDLKTAANWPKYKEYYHDVFEECSKEFPWYIVPSDQKWYKEYFVAKTIVDTLKGFKLEYPKYVPET
jgi:PPK2 family polyphosphate:nucleotide phosphotransferase